MKDDGILIVFGGAIWLNLHVGGAWQLLYRLLGFRAGYIHLTDE